MMQEIMNEMQEADMVLVGLGEDFNNKKYLNTIPQYLIGSEKLNHAGYAWLIPAWGEFCTIKNGNSEVYDALKKLSDLLQDKNYFVVSVASNSEVEKVSWKYDRIVMPCGSSLKKQCEAGCEEILNTTNEDLGSLDVAFDKLYSTLSLPMEEISLGKCEKCGKKLIFNNIFAEKYTEAGYLTKWELYKKWLQGTLNRKLFILELGVGMKYPSVIRWPFEKVAFLNQRAFFSRVHERLYQLTPELSEKGCGISSNAIDWLKML